MRYTMLFCFEFYDKMFVLGTGWSSPTQAYSLYQSNWMQWAEPMFVQYPEQFNLLVKNLIRIPTLNSQWAIITWWRRNRWLETGFMFDYEANCICVQLFIVHIWYLGFPAVVYFMCWVIVLIIDSPAIES